VSETAAYSFLSWIRGGVAAGLAPGGLDVDVFVDLAADGAAEDPIKKPVRLYGPEHVLGIDPRQVIRTEPEAEANDFEPNYFAAIEFDAPELLWLFSPAPAGDPNQVRPWISLVVVRRDTSDLDRKLRPLPVLTIPADRIRELPHFDESWAWAHAQVARGTESLDTVLEKRPAQTLSRLLSSRRLEPDTAYRACVVPTFVGGVQAGLGEPVGDRPHDVWKPPAGEPARLPVYYDWEFATGPEGDFESLRDRLGRGALPSEVGWRSMDMSAPGGGLPSDLPPMGLEGALRPVASADGARPDPPDWLTEPWKTFRDKLDERLTAPPGSVETVVTPPRYGSEQTAGKPPPRPPWDDALNLDPRFRAAAGVGVRVVQEQQEQLMASAWEQASELERANRLLRQAQFAQAVEQTIYEKRLRPLPPEQLAQVTEPAHGRLPGEGETVRTDVRASVFPEAAASAPFRRALRPNGPLGRRLEEPVEGVRAGSGGVVSGLIHELSEGKVAVELKDPAGMATVDAVSQVADTPVIRYDNARSDDVRNIPGWKLIDDFYGASPRAARQSDSRRAALARIPHWEPPEGREIDGLDMGETDPDEQQRLGDMRDRFRRASDKHLSHIGLGWPRVWLPGNFGGGGTTDLFFYDPSRGEGAFYTSDGGGNLALLRPHGGLRTNNFVVAGEFGGGATTDLLFYDAVKGERAFYTTDGQGNLALLLEPTASWVNQLVVPGAFGGGPPTDLFFYSFDYEANKWIGTFYTTDGQGKVTQLGPRRTLPRGGRVIIPGDFGGGATTDLLVYDPGSGEATFYTTDGQGGLAELRRHSGWRGSWSAIVPGNFGGDGATDLFFYDPLAREAELRTTDGQGNLTLLDTYGDLRATWTAIAAGDFVAGGRDDLFFYDASSGQGATYALGADGEFDLAAVHPPPPPGLKLGTLKRDLVGGSEPADGKLNPERTIPARVASEVPRIEPVVASGDGDPLRPILAAPRFPNAMYESLRELANEFVFPGIEHVPPDTVSLFEANPAFIEAFMVGLNHEMSRELLWRGYATDRSSTYFSRFWDMRGRIVDGQPAPPPELRPIREWKGALGANAEDAGGEALLVLVIRGELIRRSPTVSVYAKRAATPGPFGDEERYPDFRGTLAPDLLFAGFGLSVEEAAGSAVDPGWFFVLQEQPTAPRFALDIAAPGDYGKFPECWPNASWGHLVTSEQELKNLVHASARARLAEAKEPIPHVCPKAEDSIPHVSLPAGDTTVETSTWGKNAAHMARILLQESVRLAIHARALLEIPGLPPSDRVTWARRPRFAALTGRITEVGGVSVGGIPWRRTTAEAIALLEARPASLYVEGRETGERIPLVVGRLFGRKYLKTAADKLLANNLRKLPQWP
jgi:hypothetical protein